jgi:hypothetical protein
MRNLAKLPRLHVAAAAGLALAAARPTVKEEMKSVVEPTTNVLFAVGGEVDPGNGPDAAKAPPARWKAAADAAARLKTVAAALMTPDQARSGDEWVKDAKQLHDLAEVAEAASMAKDGAKLSDTANTLGDTCTACHSKYKPQTGS